MSKQLIRLSQTIVDLTTLALAFAIGFFVRFDGLPPAPMTGRLLLTGPYVILFEYLLLVAFGIHRFSWRYVGLREATRILIACACSTAVLVLARLAAGELQYGTAYLRHGVIPFGVIAVNAVLSFLGITGMRVGRRILGEHRESQRRKAKGAAPTRTLLIGAGQAGVLVARELASRPDLALKPIGFLDDDPRKVGSVIHGIPVLGKTSQLPELRAKHNAKQALITMANVPGGVIRRIRELCEEARIPVKIIPGVYEIVGGKVNLSRIRDVAIEDLLGRDPVELDRDQLKAFVTGKVVLTTGAGGSIGSELCRQICRYSPAQLVLVERAENALFAIHRELTAAHPDLDIVPCIADVTDLPRMKDLLASHEPSLVLHAAAHKHVPIMEWNPGEAIKNNVFGTKVIADLAVSQGVEAFVMISTDKAVNPTSVMGASKRVAETYVQSLTAASTTRFVVVRFGNVLGSTGSVVPIFKDQIAQGGPVTVTHPEMQRYFMTIPEACQLVLQAGAMGRGGEIFVLDMGRPVKIVDLARDLIALSGLREGEDIQIEFSGIRPGEKLFEELSTNAENADKTRHPKIFVGRTRPAAAEEVRRALDKLRSATESGKPEDVIAALRLAVPEFRVAKPQPAKAAAEPRTDAEVRALVPNSVLE